MRKNIARNAPPLRPSTSVDWLSVRERNSRSGTSGALERDSTTRKSASSATPATREPTTSPEPQPSGSERITP